MFKFIFGYYQYNSIAEFNADKVAFYQRVYGRKTLGSASGKGDVAQLGFYIQDEWAVLPHLKIMVSVLTSQLSVAPERNDSIPKYLRHAADLARAEIYYGHQNWFLLGC